MRGKGLAPHNQRTSTRAGALLVHPPLEPSVALHVVVRFEQTGFILAPDNPIETFVPRPGFLVGSNH